MNEWNGMDRTWMEWNKQMEWNCAIRQTTAQNFDPSGNAIGDTAPTPANGEYK